MAITAVIEWETLNSGDTPIACHLMIRAATKIRDRNIAEATW